MLPIPRLFQILAFTVLAFPSRAQSVNPVPEKSIPVQAVGFTTDNLGNIYFITKDSGLIKYDIRTDTTITYSDYRYGALGSVDAANPLQPLLFYPDFGTILVMDRFLSVQNTIDLRVLNIFKADAAAASNDNRIWVFDEQQAKLKKIDLNGNSVLETVDLRTVLGLVPQPNLILDQGGMVYCCDSSRGIFVFDYYGTYRNELHFTGISSLQWFNSQLIFYHDGKLTRYDLRTLEQKELPIPDPDHVLMARLERDRLYVLRKGRMDLYPIR
ncbi:MAG TPA: hypothetical protein VMV20_06965 [Chitinophagaceae bacterium]|nr:hypothetical protein [Chitinophagaceae bacterium]